MRLTGSTFRPALLAVVVLLVNACTESNVWNESLEDLLRNQPEHFDTIMQDPELYRVQIIYTQIDRDANNVPGFRSFRYRVDSDEYFYPASTVKLPTVLLALEKLNQLNIQNLNRNTSMLTGVARQSQTSANEDRSARSGLPSVGHYIRKILLVSDNDAFNRLYEFIGQESLNASLRAKGLEHTRIMHRLESALSVEENRHTNPVSFYTDGARVFEQPPAYSEKSYIGNESIFLGRAEVVNRKLQHGPKDFSVKNEFSLQDLHDTLLALMFPDSVAAERRYALTEEDYRFLYRNMSAYPADSGIERYGDTSKYPAGYVKFLMYGGEGNHLPGNIRIYNKVGDAYGFLTDAAYIVDVANKLEFILVASIYTNANETFNDNNYEYAETGLPFMRDLGNAIYALERNRERLHVPDFSRIVGSE